jgi:hypothetical protein
MLSYAVKQATITTISEQLTPKQNRVQKEEPTEERSVPFEAICPCCKKGRMQGCREF